MVAPLLVPPIDPTIVAIAAVDPLTVDDDDFQRHHDPALWRGLSVQAIGFSDAGMGLAPVADRQCRTPRRAVVDRAA